MTTLNWGQPKQSFMSLHSFYTSLNSRIISKKFKQIDTQAIGMQLGCR